MGIYYHFQLVLSFLDIWVVVEDEELFDVVFIPASNLVSAATTASLLLLFSISYAYMVRNLNLNEFVSVFVFMVMVVVRVRVRVLELFVNRYSQQFLTHSPFFHSHSVVLKLFFICPK
jgi:hypothetical protein